MTSDLELFAQFVRDEAKKERDAKKAARDERRQADEHNQLVKAKEDAAALVKRLRGSERATAEEKAEADAAYKAALAAVVAAETGESPTWAPPAPEPDAPAEGESPAAAEEEAAASDEAPAADDAEAAPTTGDDAPETPAADAAGA